MLLACRRSLKPGWFFEEFHNTWSGENVINYCINLIHAEPKNDLMVSSIFWVSSSVKGYWQAKGLTEGRKTGNEQ